MRVRGIPWQRAALGLGFACLVVAVVRRPSRATLPQPDRREAPLPPAPRLRERERGSILARSVALVFLATLLFAVGAALGGALGASADDGAPAAAASDSTGTTTDDTTATTTGSTTGEETTTAPPPTTTEVSPPPSVVTGVGSLHPHHQSSTSQHQASPAPRAKSHYHHKRAPITWVPRVLPDPIETAHRLSQKFAEDLRVAAAAHNVYWWRVLAILRAHGHDSRVPARPAKLDTVARRLANHKIRLGARIYSLAHYDRAVGLRALVTGLERAKPRLERRILRDRSIELSAAGAGDVASGRVDVRVLVVIRYLAVTFHQVTVSSLITGHPMFARPRVISAHMDGLAVDISRLNGISIYGHQQLGSITERAIESLLRLPQELQAKQIISLLGLGGPSFPLHNHYDHIHVGF
jgi:hypothetical protein